MPKKSKYNVGGSVPQMPMVGGDPSGKTPERVDPRATLASAKEANKTIKARMQSMTPGAERQSARAALQASRQTAKDARTAIQASKTSGTLPGTPAARMAKGGDVKKQTRPRARPEGLTAPRTSLRPQARPEGLATMRSINRTAEAESRERAGLVRNKRGNKK